MEVNITRRERKIGNWRVDIEAEDELGTVVIENQLERSDHEHLGKLLNYAIALDAKRAVWITTDPHPTHTDVVNRLNEEMTIKFYLAKIEAVRIGESEPAPIITLVAGPTEEAADVGQAHRERSEEDQLRYQFWDRFLVRANARTDLHSGNNPTDNVWISSRRGLPRGLGLTYWIHPHRALAELRIEGQSPEYNQAVFSFFEQQKDAIEASFGGELSWITSERARVRRIARASKQEGCATPIAGLTLSNR